MVRLRLSVLGIALLFATVALVGCSSPAAFRDGTVPTDLPRSPEACTKYCKVWVPAVYRDVPVIVQKKCASKKQVAEQVLVPRYHEVCERQRCQYGVRTAGMACEKAVVQVKAGGYKWKRDGDCWRYCYEEPCYQWCNKVVQDDGIEYCMEVPPKYRVECTLEEQTRYRTVHVPAEWETKWVKRLYTPGHWEWQPVKECNTCDCPAPCPTLPYRRNPCPEGSAITNTCPPCN